MTCTGDDSKVLHSQIEYTIQQNDRMDRIYIYTQRAYIKGREFDNHVDAYVTDTFQRLA